GVVGSGATSVAEAKVKGTGADKLTVAEVKRPSRHAPPLHFDLGIVDMVARRTGPATEGSCGLAHSIAIQETRQAHFVVAALPAVAIGLARAGHALVVVVLAGGDAQQPVTVGQRVV